jgi:hypothetical protein
MEMTKENSRNRAEAFLKLNALAIIGVSEKKTKFGNTIFKELKSKNIDVYQIHKSFKSLNFHPCYTSLTDIPKKVEGIILNVKREKTKSLIEEYFNQGITNFWIQQGSDSLEAREFTTKHSINTIYGKCILMFANPVSSIHKFHRVLWNWFGKK